MASAVKALVILGFLIAGSVSEKKRTLREAFPVGPFNLKTTVLEAEDGYCTVEVIWSVSGCNWDDDATVSLSDGVETTQNVTVATKSGFARFPKVDYWTRYRVYLDSGRACGGSELSEVVQTGPGKPHKPLGVKFNVTDTTAEYAIVEAPMPREITGYSVLLCEEGPALQCRQEEFIDHDALDEMQKGVFENLLPDTVYRYSYAPIIRTSNATFRGNTLNGTFTTNSADLPEVSEISANFVQRDSTLRGRFAWELPESKFSLQYFSARLEPCHLNCHLIAFEPSVEFVLPPGEKVTLEVVAHFVVKNRIQRVIKKEEIITPELVQEIDQIDVAKLSPTEVCIGWNSTEKGMWQIEYCKELECKKQNVPGHEACFAGLKPNSTYTVEVVYYKDGMEAHVFNGTFETLEYDYPSPDVRTMSVLTRGSLSVVYEFDFWLDSVPDQIFLKACVQGGDSCLSNSTAGNQTSVDIRLQYFTTYECTVTAVYNLKLGRVVRKTGFAEVSTVGMDPGVVRRLRVSNVQSTSAVVSWDRPENLPDDSGLIVQYEVSGSGFNNATSETHMNLVNLPVYSNVSVFIVTKVVDSDDKKFVGKPANISFETDVGTPGPVIDFQVDQAPFQPNLVLSWKPPKPANGPLGHYGIEFGPEGHRETIDVNQTRALLERPALPVDAVERFAVYAYNVKRDGQQVRGRPTDKKQNILGVDIVLHVSVSARTDTSLIFEFNTSGSNSKEKTLFFVRDSGNKTVSSARRAVSIQNRQPFTEENFFVKGCVHNADFCTEEVVVKAQTNVGKPSAVQDLRTKLVDLTNVELSWNPPELKNGPLDGYLVTVFGESQKSALNFTVFNTTSFVFKSTSEYEMFSFTVRAFNKNLDNANESVYGEPAKHDQRTSGQAPPKPLDLGVSEANETSVMFKWRPGPSDERWIIKAYRVKLLKPNRPEFFTANLWALIEDLPPFTDIEVAVSSCTANRTETCGQKKNLDAKTDCGTPGEPTNLQIEVVNETVVNVSWERPEVTNGIIDVYYLEIKDEEGKTFTETQCRNTSYIVRGVDPHVDYTIRLRASNFPKNQHSKRKDSEIVSGTFRTVPSPLWPKIVGPCVALLVLGAVMAGIVLYWRRPGGRFHGDQERLIE